MPQTDEDSFYRNMDPVPYDGYTATVRHTMPEGVATAVWVSGSEFVDVSLETKNGTAHCRARLVGDRYVQEIRACPLTELSLYSLQLLSSSLREEIRRKEDESLKPPIQLHLVSSRSEGGTPVLTLMVHEHEIYTVLDDSRGLGDRLRRLMPLIKNPYLAATQDDRTLAIKLAKKALEHYE